MIHRETISDWMNLFHDGAISIVTLSPHSDPNEPQIDFKTVLQRDADVLMVIREDLLDPDNVQALHDGMQSHLKKVEARADSLAGLESLLTGSQWLSFLPLIWLGIRFWINDFEILLWEYIYPILVSLFLGGIKRLILLAMKWFIRYKLKSL